MVALEKDEEKTTAYTLRKIIISQTVEKYSNVLLLLWFVLSI